MAAETDTLHITRYTKRIQPDGFLIEWSSEGATSFDRSGGHIAVDVAVTPEGVAGYVAYGAADLANVQAHEVRLFAQLSAIHRSQSLFFSSDSLSPIGRVAVDSQAVAEFVIPWEQLSVDSAGAFMLGLVLLRPGLDTLGPVYIKGNKNAPGGSVLTLGVQRRLAAVLILLALYLGFLISVRKKRPHPRQSLHQ